MSKPPAGKGHSHKHSGNHPPKHQHHVSHGKHQHHARGKHKPGHHNKGPWGGGGPGGGGGNQPPILISPKTHHHKPARRGYSPGLDVACCSAQALGLLLGWGWDDVLALYWRTASDPDAGATIEDTLAVSSEYGHHAHMIGERGPVRFMELDGRGLGCGHKCVDRADSSPGTVDRGGHFVDGAGEGDGDFPVRVCRIGLLDHLEACHTGHPSRLILGVTLPEPHAIAVTPDGTWWSWGEPFEPCDWPDLTVEEAWAISWP